MTHRLAHRPLAAWGTQVQAWALGAALLLSQADAGAQGEMVLRTPVEQKVRLVSRMLNDSDTAQRIGKSGNADAVAHLDEGRVHHALAEDLLAKGDLPGAMQAADDAFRHLSLARRLVPDAAGKHAALRQRYEQLLASTERLIAAWTERLPAASRRDGGPMASALGLLNSARGHADAGRLEEANQALALAEQHMMEGMLGALKSRTLDYTARPSSPQEEFLFEQRRLASLEELIPVALRDLKPRAEAVALVGRYQEAAAALRAKALARQGEGDTAQALADLHSAVQYVQRALQAAGLALPSPSEGSP